MPDHKLVGKHVSEFLPTLGPSLAVPQRPPEGDPEYGLDRYIECQDRGLAVMINENDICCCVQLFGAGKDPSYDPYAGDLPGGTKFSNSRSEVRGVMGPPVKSSDGGADSFSVRHTPWDMFICDGLKVHFEYAEAGQRVLMVSLMPVPAET